MLFQSFDNTTFYVVSFKTDANRLSNLLAIFAQLPRFSESKNVLIVKLPSRKPEINLKQDYISQASQLDIKRILWCSRCASTFSSKFLKSEWSNRYFGLTVETCFLFSLFEKTTGNAAMLSNVSLYWCFCEMERSRRKRTMSPVKDG